MLLLMERREDIIWIVYLLKKDILYIRGNGIWKIENEQIWIENALCKK